ncbi:MAG: outer membrane beta-barrel protein [Deltaproteobacteria bacterium]|nr:outer membrane beta-barrel protein [Deltaproteobacteria bacterium]
MFRKTLLTLALALATTTPAWAVTFSLEGLVNQSGPVVNNTNSYTAKLGYGGGAELGFMLGGGFGLDFGALYVQRKFDTVPAAAPGMTIESTQTGIEIPIIARFWLANVISIGGGAYYMSYMGDIARTTTTGGVSSASNVSYSEAAQSKSDVGLVASIRLDVPLGIMTGFVLDGRYEYGLKNNSTSGDAKFRDMTGIVGIRFGWMK